MSKWIKNKNVWIIAALIIVIALLFLLSRGGKDKPAIGTDSRQIDLTATAEPVVTAEPEATAEPKETVESVDTVSPETASQQLIPRLDYDPAGYVLVSLPSSNQYGMLPLPKEGEVSYPIQQTFIDGTETENVLLLKPDGFCMHSSTCANQDCVGQGEVTFENREERILSNSVICLPNQLIAELYTPEELDALSLAPADTGYAGGSED